MQRGTVYRTVDRSHLNTTARTTSASAQCLGLGGCRTFTRRDPVILQSHLGLCRRRSCRRMRLNLHTLFAVAGSVLQWLAACRRVTTKES